MREYAEMKSKGHIKWFGCSQRSLEKKPWSAVSFFDDTCHQKKFLSPYEYSTSLTTQLYDKMFCT